MFRAVRVLCRPAAPARLSAGLPSPTPAPVTGRPSVMQVALIDRGRVADHLRAIMLQPPDAPVRPSADVHRVLELVLLAIVHCGSQYLALHRAFPTAGAGDVTHGTNEQVNVLLDKEHEWHRRLRVLTLLLRRLCRLQRPLPARTLAPRVPAVTPPAASISPRARPFIWRIRRQREARLKAIGRRRMLGMLHSGTVCLSSFTLPSCLLTVMF
jgi:hypothetical protein